MAVCLTDFDTLDNVFLPNSATYPLQRTHVDSDDYLTPLAGPSINHHRPPANYFGNSKYHLLSRLLAMQTPIASLIAPNLIAVYQSSPIRW